MKKVKLETQNDFAAIDCLEAKPRAGRRRIIQESQGIGTLGTLSLKRIF